MTQTFGSSGIVIMGAVISLDPTVTGLRHVHSVE